MTDIDTLESSTGSAGDASADAPTDYVANVSFDELGLSDELRRAVAERGYQTPTPVQAKAFAPVVAGKDLIVRSKTGTGKTAAFSMPVLQRIPNGERQVKALVLCPTRELAIQVADEMVALSKHKDIRVATIYGGASMKLQEEALASGSAVVVGTPGRVDDHIRRGNLKLEGCTHVVLDEADEMLSQGFYEEVTAILDRLPASRQVLLFSATVPPDIENLIARYTRNAETLLMSGDVYTVDHIHHVRIDISDEFPKPRNLIYVLEMANPENAIIFCNTRDDTTLVNAVLNRNGFDSEVLNGDLPQKERERVMAKVKRGEVAFMVATDIAARGIDISDLGHVINYSLPEDPAVYLHRVGRTGRIGKKGVAINLTSGKELATLTALERQYKIQFEKRQMPSPDEAARLWTLRHVKEIREAAQGSIYEGYLPLAAQLKTRPDADDLLAFLLKQFFTQHRMEKLRAQGHEEPERRPEPPRERPERERRFGRDREPRRERPDRGNAPEGERSSRERPDRERRPRSESVEPGPGEVKLWANLGRADALADELAIKAALGEQGAPGDRVLRVDLRPTFSYLIVAESDAPLFESCTGKQRGDKALKVERSRERTERPRRERTERTQNSSATPPAVLGGDASFETASAPAETMPPPTAVAPPSPHDSEPGTGEVATATLPAAASSPHRNETPEPALEPGKVKLWANLGRMDKLDEAGLTQALEGLGAPAGAVLRVELRGTYAYLVVGESDVPAFEALTGKSHGDKALKVERSRERTERPRKERAERSERPERPPRAASPSGGPSVTVTAPAQRSSVGAGEVRLYVNLGRSDGLDERGIRSAFDEVAGCGEKVRNVELRGTFAYAHVSENDAAAFEALAGRAFREKTLKIERTRKS